MFYLGILQVIANLFLVSSIDPGIIPRNDQEATRDEVGTSNGTKRKRVIVNGVEIKLRYCRICKIYRPPRSCHCALCDNCVEKFDHHSPWIGQCIALVRSQPSCCCSAFLFLLGNFERQASRPTGIG